MHSGYVYNETGTWLDDYGFGECNDLKRCNVFPDGKPFPQSNDWRRKGYVYVWHTMGEREHVQASILYINAIKHPTMPLNTSTSYKQVESL